MLDPKLNELSSNAERGSEDTLDEASLTEAQRAERKKRLNAGLSINDTIARDANLSVGARGTDTSGVSAGAGAGAGSTYLGPGRSDSPAPSIVPDARSSGTTARGAAGADQDPALHLELDGEESEPSSEEISARAHECWHERGCPDGSPEVDWHRAQEELRAKRRKLSFTASA